MSQGPVLARPRDADLPDLVNLLNNAHDAVVGLPNPWIELEIKDTGAQVMISVSDSGPGIPEEIRQKIGQPFFD